MPLFIKRCLNCKIKHLYKDNLIKSIQISMAQVNITSRTHKLYNELLTYFVLSVRSVIYFERSI